MDGSRDRGVDGEKWSSSNGTNGKRRDSAESSAGAASSGPLHQPRTSHRRVGTYERERQQRCSVLHYLTVATMPQRGTKQAASPANGASEGGAAAGEGAAATAGGGEADATNGAASSSSPSATSGAVAHPDGATAAGLLAAMRERPWEGRPSAGTAQDWAEWLEYLDPTLERHLRWLVVDGLAVQTNRDGEQEARFVAVRPPPQEQEDEAAEPGGQESAGRLSAPATGGRAAAGGGGAGPGADKLAPGSSMLAGGVRIMKSRPIKMVKPWR